MCIKSHVFLIISCLLTVFVASENVTTIFELEAGGKGADDYENFGTWKVILRNDARGIPVRRGNIGLSNVWAGQPCCESWSRDGWTKLDDQEALKQNPPLEVASFESADSKLSEQRNSESAVHFQKDDAGVWRGPMALNSRARLSFLPPKSGRAALGIFLCDSEDVGDTHCVAIVITGSNASGKRLRYQATRYGNREPGSRRPTPNGLLKTYVVRRDDRVREGWDGSNSYNFRIERNGQGDLEVQLDYGDVDQRRKMNIAGGYNYNQLAVSLLAAASDTPTKLEVTRDSTWLGDLPPGGSMKVNFSPKSPGFGRLGFALCADRLRIDCTAEVVDGFHNGRIHQLDGINWIPGFQEAENPVSNFRSNARWEDPTTTVTLTRAHDGTVTITGGRDQKGITWAVPAKSEFLAMDSYLNEGDVNVNTAIEKIAASVWRLDKEAAELRSPPIAEAFVAGDVCVSVVARVNNAARLVVSVQRYGSQNEKRDLETFTSSSGSQWVKKRILIRPSRILQNNKVQIVLTATQPANARSPVLVQWAAGCDPNGEEDVVTISEFVPARSLTDQTGFQSIVRLDQMEFFGQNLTPRKHPVCQNDGLITKDFQCICQSGFNGRVCEKGCGPNRFGEHCESRCSDEFSQRECKGMWLCTADMPCECGPGLTGPHCDQPCEKGKYGIGCRQKCGQCQYGQTCDRYTGWCTTGCTGTLLPPFCREECGRKTVVVAYIGHGDLADPIAYPWHVGIYKNSIVASDSKSERVIDQICGGTLISKNVVVSAAHCFYDDALGGASPPDQFSVGFGKYKRGWNAREEFPGRVQKRNIEAIHLPPEFRGVLASREDDIAVLELSSPIEDSPYVVPACFDEFGGFEEELRPGSVGHVAGWGKMENNVPSEDLREASLPFISRLECLDSVSPSFRPYVLARDRFCAGERGASFVNKGDSGGGLVFLQNSAWFLRGIVSLAPSDDMSLSVYTNVSSHRDWIVDIEHVAALRKAYYEAFYPD